MYFHCTTAPRRAPLVLWLVVGFRATSHNTTAFRPPAPPPLVPPPPLAAFLWDDRERRDRWCGEARPLRGGRRRSSSRGTTVIGGRDGGRRRPAADDARAQVRIRPREHGRKSGWIHEPHLRPWTRTTMTHSPPRLVPIK